MKQARAQELLVASSAFARGRRVEGHSRGAGSLTDRAYKEIKFRIITCRYRPGEVLSEAQVSEGLKIGRTPVHEAVQRLVMDGLLHVLPRKGIMVRPITIDEAMDIVAVRLVTECFCARLAAERAGQSELERLEEIVKASERIIARRDVEQLMLLDRDFHDTLARAAGNGVLADVLRNLHERSLRFWFISLLDAEHQKKILAQHRAIVDALKSRKANAADAAMREHILAFQRNVTREV
jgi:DNA-binding GntR family transcriptional regulator